MRKYMVYVDDGREAMRLAIPAESQKAARKYVNGNGEVIAVKDVTDDYPISSTKVSDALAAAGFNRIEIDFIIRALDQCELTTD